MSIARSRNEVHQDVERALVGPLDVVDQQHHRCGAGQVLQPGIQQCGGLVDGLQLIQRPGPLAPRNSCAGGGPERQQGHADRLQW